MTIAGVEAPCVIPHSRFNFQTACACGACPIRANERRAPLLSRIARGEIFVRAPSTGEGHGAPRGAVCIVSLPASRAKRWSPEAHRLAALHSRRFWARGPYFRMGRANLIRSAFAAFIRIPCSRERQSHVVGPDGDPSLPDATGANRARRRRILLRFKAPSRSAPHEQDMRTIFLDREMSRSPSFRGARLRANPESTPTHELPRSMDSGPTPRRIPE
jgi:hypothetical protein